MANNADRLVSSDNATASKPLASAAEVAEAQFPPRERKPARWMTVTRLLTPGDAAARQPSAQE